MQSLASTFDWKRLCLSCHRSLVRKVEPDSFNFDERLQGCPISPTITCAQPHALPCFPSGHSWVTQSVTDRKSHVMLPRHTVTSVSTPLLPASWWLGPPGCPSPPLDLHWVGGGRRHEGSEGGHGLADGLDRQVLGVGPHVVGPRPPTTGSAHHHHHGTTATAAPPPQLPRSRLRLRVAHGLVPPDRWHLLLADRSTMGDEEDRPPPPRPDPDSLEGLQLTINEKSDETLECTRRMREMCAEAKDAGMKTLIALDDQEVKSKLSSYLLQGMSNHSYSLKYQRLGEGGWGEQNLNFSRKSKMESCS